MDSLLRYIGKRRLNLEYEISNFKFDIYCEPFSGSFNSGINLISSGYTSGIVINDLDNEIYNYWVCLKTDPLRLYTIIYDLNRLLNIADCFDSRVGILLKYKKSDNFSRAAAEFMIKNNTGLHGLNLNRVKSIPNREEFITQSELIQRAIVSNYDYSEVLLRYDSPNTFFYIDPPYNIDRVGNYYRCDSGLFHHEALCNAVKNLKANWLMTYNCDGYIYHLYKKQNVYMIGKPLFGDIYNEFVITNYDKPTNTILDFISKGNLEEYILKSRGVTPEMFDKFIEEGKTVDTVAVNIDFDSVGFD